MVDLIIGWTVFVLLWALGLLVLVDVGRWLVLRLQARRN
ncbi:hypothetical protein LCGC14_1604500 [marine sediment metagenome]|uniref:Uncharacterized protein n=1 Tax=marine sediment metagenome TaxID=412755 RepID=A0A0F9IWR5_9ZZZZ